MTMLLWKDGSPPKAGKKRYRGERAEGSRASLVGDAGGPVGHRQTLAGPDGIVLQTVRLAE
jgi:hypothetical protein